MKKRINLNTKNLFLILIVIFLLGLVLLLTTEQRSQIPYIKAGKVAQEDIVALKNYEYIDHQATEEKKRMASESIGIVYSIDETVGLKVEKNIQSIFKLAKKIINEDKSVDVKIYKLQKKLTFKLPYSTLKILVSLSEEKLNKLEFNCIEIAKKILKQQFREQDMEKEFQQINSLVDYQPFEKEEAELIKAILKACILPNSFPDINKTLLLQEKARQEVIPVKVPIQKGEIILNKGKVVTERDVDILQQIGLLQSSSSSILQLIGSAIIFFLLLTIFIFYLYLVENKLTLQLNFYLLLSIIAAFTLILGDLLKLYSWYLIPVSMASLLTGLLFNFRLGSVFGLLISTLFILIPESKLEYIFVLSIGAITGALTTLKATKRFNILQGGLIIGIINGIIILAFNLIDSIPLSESIQNIGWGIAGGIISSIIAIGVLPLFENLFNITTPIRLLELLNPTEPLLQRLLLEAPGTYHHSIIVANLAEEAAVELKANSILCRVGAFYHDIGKIKRPGLFIENQLGENPHKHITPTLSTLAIISHVKDGIALAKEYKLPPAIIDFIPQHHGTSLVYYFYQQAKEKGEEAGEEINKEDFRYGGPKPQSKETAIVMLADSAEASVRTLKKPTPQKIEETIQKIIDRFLYDGQFDECNLTFRDLNIIKTAFTKILASMYHSRIEYPEFSDN